VLTVSNNPFWNNVVKGIDTAADYLKKDNVTVDKKEFNDFDGQAFSDAIDTCIAQKYDAICTVGVADTIVPSIDKATAAGIPVYTFNSDTAKQSTRVAFVGQDLYSAGSKLADTMAEIMGDQGKVGVITGSYKVNAHELRRQGFEDEMKNKHPNIKVVGDVENNDSGDEAYTAAKNFITANPDLTGIAVMAGGPQGAAKALSELKMSDKVTLVCFDTTEEIISYLKTGDIKATITQDPFGQGCDPIILAYNQLVTGQPQVTGNAFTKMDVYTPDNVDTIPQ
jgi:ribose transport system substrate-binding protein